MWTVSADTVRGQAGRPYNVRMNRDYTPFLDRIAARQDSMRDTVIELANVNSGSFNAEGVNRVGERLIALYASLAPSVESIAVEPFRSTTNAGTRFERPLGRAVRLRQRPEAPVQVFLCGHLDTVYGADHAFQSVRHLDEDTLHGPGVADLKGGLVAMHAALDALEHSPWRESIGWEVLFNPDEEIGSQGSAPLLAEAAARHRFGLIYEPSFPDGHLAGARKGSGNFDLVVRGRAAHAGREHHLGRNAIRAGADFVSALDALNGQREGVTINPGYIHGGGALNVVPELAVVKFNVRTSSADDERWMLDHIEALVAGLQARDGIGAELHGGFTRPPKPHAGATARLAELIADCGRTLGIDLEFKPTGGCCDGNNLAALGLPNIDNLGVVGGKIHSDEEYMRISSLTERAQLSALLLLRLASGEISL